MKPDPKLADVCRSLALRSRMGDQNATGTIEEMQKNAAAGDERARLYLPVVQKWLADHPVSGTTGVSDRGAELIARLAQCFAPPFVGVAQVFIEMAEIGEEGLYEGACALISRGPEVGPATIQAVLGQFPNGARERAANAFEVAGEPTRERTQAKNRVEAGACMAGRCLGQARRWQGVRAGAPLGFLSDGVEWELEG